MNTARRMLVLAYRAHQRGETDIAARIATLAFNNPESASLMETLASVETSIGFTSEKVEADKLEDTIRKAEAAVQGDLFTEAGASKLLAIAQKLHAEGFPKLAKSLAAVTS